MVSAFARLVIIAAASGIFLMAGGTSLPVAPVVLTYLGSYAIVSAVSAVFSLKRFFHPWSGLVFTAIDGMSLALLIGFALKVTGSPLSLHAAVPGFVFVFCILILATMRYTVGPVLIVFVSFCVTWWLFSIFAAGVGPDASVTQAGLDPGFFFGPVQNAARWGFLGIATLLSLLAVVRRRKTLEAAISASKRTANLSRYLPDRIATIVADQGIEALTSARQQNATVMFIDIRGFTGLSERMSPDDLSVYLRDFRALVSAEVDAHGGFIEKFIGDAVMAVFGVPDQTEQAEADGLRCAIAVRHKIGVRNAAQPGQHTDVTIGVHCGEVFAGAVGTEDRLEFTVLGDTVNIAARLQEQAKDTQSGLVVSQILLERSGALDAGAGRWTSMKNSTLRGRVGAIALYQYGDARTPK